MSLDSIWPVKWKKINGNNLEQRLIVKNSVLVLDFLSEKHFGEYVCTSSNVYGQASKRLSVHSDRIVQSALVYEPSSNFKRKFRKKLRKRLKSKRQKSSQSNSLLRKFLRLFG